MVVIAAFVFSLLSITSTSTRVIKTVRSSEKVAGRLAADRLSAVTGVAT